MSFSTSKKMKKKNKMDETTDALLSRPTVTRKRGKRKQRRKNLLTESDIEPQMKQYQLRSVLREINSLEKHLIPLARKNRDVEQLKILSQELRKQKTELERLQTSLDDNQNLLNKPHASVDAQTALTGSRRTRETIRAIRKKYSESVDLVDADVALVNDAMDMKIKTPEELAEILDEVRIADKLVDSLDDKDLEVDMDALERGRKLIMPTWLKEANDKDDNGFITNWMQDKKRRKALAGILGGASEVNRILGGPLSKKTAWEKPSSKAQEQLRLDAVKAYSDHYQKTLKRMVEHVDAKNVAMVRLPHPGLDAAVIIYDVITSMQKSKQKPGAIFVEAPAALRLHESPAKAITAWLKKSGELFSPELGGVLVEAEKLGWDIVPIDATSVENGDTNTDLLRASKVKLSENDELVDADSRGNIPRQNYIAKTMRAYAIKNPSKGGILTIGGQHLGAQSGGRLREMVSKPKQQPNESTLNYNKSKTGKVLIMRTSDVLPNEPYYQDSDGKLVKTIK